jgi:uncharacterized protein YecT (DUF1311 family)
MEKLILALLLLASPASAQECKYDGSQIQMNACAKQDYRAADAALNKAYYNKLKSIQTEKGRETLIAQQRAWIQRRDARCKFKKDEGSNATIDHLTCLQSLTEIRTLQLLTFSKPQI